MKNFRDIEQLSAYLDGQLNPSDSARLESRISSDPELASVLSDLRAARGILRKLPARKAPRNFTLTRKMVGLKPPLPRTFSFFRLSTAFATLLLIFTFAVNLVLPGLSMGMGGAAAPAAQEAFGLGGGGGCDEPCPSIAAATEAPVATEAPSIELAPILPTESLPSTLEDTSRIGETPAVETPMAKTPDNVPEPQDQPQVDAKREAVIPITWQIGLLIIGLVSAIIAFVINQNAKRKWS